jgi:glutamyl-tRNA reductase
LIIKRLAELSHLASEELEKHIYQMEDRDAVDHLMRVACGLDSQLLGETQILGQVAHSCSAPRSTGAPGPLLTYLFSRAAHTGKRARSETEISRGATSISHAAVALLEKELGDLAAMSVLVIGAGETAELAVQALHKHGATEITCINRSLTGAQEMASRTGCRARPWAELTAALAGADALIAATGAPHPVIYSEDVEPALALKRVHPLVVIDVAVPRDVDLEVGELPGVILHDIDKLDATLDHNLRRRRAAVPQVEKIIAEESQGVMNWLHGREATEVVADLREHARLLARTELEAALRKLEGLDDNAQEVISRMTHRIVNKLLHQPTERLKSKTVSEDFAAYRDVVADLFGLKAEPVSPSARVMEEAGDG